MRRTTCSHRACVPTEIVIGLRRTLRRLCPRDSRIYVNTIAKINRPPAATAGTARQRTPPAYCELVRRPHLKKFCARLQSDAPPGSSACSPLRSQRGDSLPSPRSAARCALAAVLVPSCSTVLGRLVAAGLIAAGPKRALCQFRWGNVVNKSYPAALLNETAKTENASKGGRYAKEPLSPLWGAILLARGNNPFTSARKKSFRAVRGMLTKLTADVLGRSSRADFVRQIVLECSNLGKIQNLRNISFGLLEDNSRKYAAKSGYLSRFCRFYVLRKPCASHVATRREMVGGKP